MFEKRNSTNHFGEPVLTITVTGTSDVYRFANHMTTGQVEFAAAGYAVLRSLRRRLGRPALRWLNRTMLGVDTDRVTALRDRRVKPPVLTERMATGTQDQFGAAGSRLKGYRRDLYALLVRQFLESNQSVFAEAYSHAERAYRSARTPAMRRYWKDHMAAAQAGAVDHR